MKLLKMTKTVIAFTILLALITPNFCELQYLDEKVKEDPNKDEIFSITEGTGYSSQQGRLADTACYKVTQQVIGDQEGEINFTQSSSSSEVTDAFGMSASLEGGYGLFSGSAQVNFMKDLKETSSSISINYYQKVSHKVRFFYDFDGTNILNENGKSQLRNNGSLFKLECGDKVVRSFTEYAGLIFSISLSFNSTNEKKSFQAGASVSYGAFLSAAAEIKSNVEKTSAKAKLLIKATQIGGVNGQLAKIFGSDKLEKECKLDNIEDCKLMLQAMIDYATDDFPKQLNSSKDEAKVGRARFQKMGDVETDPVSLAKISSIDSKTYLNNTIMKQRLEFEDLYKKLYVFRKELSKYTEDWDKTFPYKHNGISKEKEFMPINKYMVDRLNEVEKDFKLMSDEVPQFYKEPNHADKLYKNLKDKLTPNLITNIEKAMEISKHYYTFEMPCMKGCSKKTPNDCKVEIKLIPFIKEEKTVWGVSFSHEGYDKIRYAEIKFDNKGNLKNIEVGAFYRDLENGRLKYIISIKEIKGNLLIGKFDSDSYLTRRIVGERKVYPHYFKYPIF